MHPQVTISPGPLQDLLTRTCTRSCKTALHVTRISTTSFHKDLYKIMQGPLKEFHQDLYKLFSEGIVNDLDQDLHANTSKIISQDRQKKPADCGEDLTRSWYKKLRRTSQRTIQRSFHTRTSKNRLSSRSSCKGLLERTSPGSPQDLLYRDLRKIIHGPLRAFQKIFTGSSDKDK